MNENPLISIMMPACNAERYIHEALDSLSAQTYENFEVIIIDDASVDNTYAIASEYQKKDKRFRVFQHGENMGIGVSRQKALVHSRGKYIAFLDSDDRWLPEKLEIFARTFGKRAKKPLCIHSNAVIIDKDGNKTGENFQNLINNENYPLEGDLHEFFLLDNWINIPSSIIEREALINVGGFRNILVLEDWDMWIRYSRVADFVYIDQELTEYRIHPQGASSADKQFMLADFREDVFRYSLDLYSQELSSSLLSRVYYLRAANLIFLGRVQEARMFFWKAWKSNPLAVQSLFRVLLGK